MENNINGRNALWWVRGGVLVAGLCLGQSTQALSLLYDVKPVSGNTWEYTYTADNTASATTVEEFTTYFDYTSYNSLNSTATPTGWDPLAIQPDPGLPDDGFYDALSTTGGLAQGEKQGGFTVQFNYTGNDIPSGQYYEVVDPATFAPLFSGTTTRSMPDPIVMEGNYVRTAISEDGTLGFGGNTSPGILHDPTGGGDFSLNDDYLTPGAPFEGFGVWSAETGLVTNDNNGGDGVFRTELSNMSGVLADNHVHWEGFYLVDGVRYFDLEQDYFFDISEERINIVTTLEAIADLTGLQFARALDPDPDVNRFGSYDTDNRRGLDANNDGDFDDPGDVKPQDFVGAVGMQSGQTIGLYSTDLTPHDTGTGTNCCSILDPDYYLPHGKFDVLGDLSIGIGFDIGDLLAGQSVSLNYAYVMGGTFETVAVNGPPVSAPEPGTLMLFGVGIAGLGAQRLRNRRKLASPALAA